MRFRNSGVSSSSPPPPPPPRPRCRSPFCRSLLPGPALFFSSSSPPLHPRRMKAAGKAPCRVLLFRMCVSRGVCASRGMCVCARASWLTDVASRHRVIYCTRIGGRKPQWVGAAPLAGCCVADDVLVVVLRSTGTEKLSTFLSLLGGGLGRYTDAVVIV